MGGSAAVHGDCDAARSVGMYRLRELVSHLPRIDKDLRPFRQVSVDVSSLRIRQKCVGASEPIVGKPHGYGRSLNEPRVLDLGLCMLHLVVQVVEPLLNRSLFLDERPRDLLARQVLCETVQ